jgi:hypothetical protein
MSLFIGIKHLHAGKPRQCYINPEHISSIAPALPDDGSDITCWITMVDRDEIFAVTTPLENVLEAFAPVDLN